VAEKVSKESAHDSGGHHREQVRRYEAVKMEAAVKFPPVFECELI